MFRQMMLKSAIEMQRFRDAVLSLDLLRFPKAHTSSQKGDPITPPTQRHLPGGDLSAILAPELAFDRCVTADLNRYLESLNLTSEL